METLLGVAAGALIGWLIAHWYYRRASVDTPEWAKPLIDKLPDAPVSIQRLVELYHDALENGEIGRPDPLGGYVACPECGDSSDNFEYWEQTDDARDDTYRGVKCGKCGYDVSWEQL